MKFRLFTIMILLAGLLAACSGFNSPVTSTQPVATPDGSQQVAPEASQAALR